MDFIIIIAVIIGIIANALKASEKAKRQQTNTGQYFPGRNPQGSNIPGSQPMPRYDTQPAEWTIQRGDYASDSMKDFKAQDVSSVYKQPEIINEPVAVDYGSYMKPFTQQTVFSDDIAKPLQVINISDVPRRHNLSFSRDSMINGIILSEVLGPPRCRRR